MNKNFLLFFLMLTSFWSLGCNSSVDADNRIYVPGREFYYLVHEIPHQAKDSIVHEIKLVVKNPEFPQSLFEQTAVEWHYIDVKKDDGYLVERTGVVEDSAGIYLHPPRMSYMGFAQIPPHPDRSFPVNLGSRAEHELAIKKGLGDTLNGKTIKSFLEVVGTENLVLGSHEYKDCFVLEGNTLNYADELGVYYAKYWLHRDFGFVKFHYVKPDSSIVIMELINEKSKL